MFGYTTWAEKLQQAAGKKPSTGALTKSAHKPVKSDLLDTSAVPAIVDNNELADAIMYQIEQAPGYKITHPYMSEVAESLRIEREYSRLVEDGKRLMWLDFCRWLQGDSNKYRPWGEGLGGGLCPLPEAKEYLDQFVGERDKLKQMFIELKLKGPRNFRDLVIYYKYLADGDTEPWTKITSHDYYYFMKPDNPSPPRDGLGPGYDGPGRPRGEQRPLAPVTPPHPLNPAPVQPGRDEPTVPVKEEEEEEEEPLVGRPVPVKEEPEDEPSQTVSADQVDELLRQRDEDHRVSIQALQDEIKQEQDARLEQDRQSLDREREDAGLINHLQEENMKQAQTMDAVRTELFALKETLGGVSTEMTRKDIAIKELTDNLARTTETLDDFRARVFVGKTQLEEKERQLKADVQTAVERTAAVVRQEAIDEEKAKAKTAISVAVSRATQREQEQQLAERERYESQLEARRLRTEMLLNDQQRAADLQRQALLSQVDEALKGGQQSEAQREATIQQANIALERQYNELTENAEVAIEKERALHQQDVAGKDAVIAQLTQELNALKMRQTLPEEPVAPVPIIEERKGIGVKRLAEEISTTPGLREMALRKAQEAALPPEPPAAVSIPPQAVPLTGAPLTAASLGGALAAREAATEEEEEELEKAKKHRKK